MRTAADGASNYVIGTGAKAEFWKSRAMAANWQSGAGSPSASANYKAGVQAAIAADAQNKGVMATPNSVYTNGISKKGDRYNTGTANAHDKVAAALGKILPDIASAISTMPARGPRGSAVNITQRGTAIQTALTKKRGSYKVRM